MRRGAKIELNTLVFKSWTNYLSHKQNLERTRKKAKQKQKQEKVTSSSTTEQLKEGNTEKEDTETRETKARSKTIPSSRPTISNHGEDPIGKPKILQLKQALKA